MSETKHPAGHVLQAYHDGELDAPTASDVAAHCQHCANCRAELADLAHVGQILASAPTPELPRTVWHRVKPGRRRDSRLKPVFAFAAGAAGVLVGVLFGPVQFSVETANNDVSWTENVSVWNSSATSSLLGVYQSSSQ